MVRSLTFVPAMLCVAAIATAQTPTPATPAEKPATPTTQQPATPHPAPATPASPSSQSAKPADSSMAASTVTYTGCLKPGTTPGTWILDNAELARQMGASASASSSAPGATASASTPGAGAVGTSGVSRSSFTLNTSPAAGDLKPHANHKIEVIGTVAAAKAGQASASVSPSGAGASASASASPARQDFTVQSFKMVSASCP
jgi:hypothetical protein